MPAPDRAQTADQEAQLGILSRCVGCELALVASQGEIRTDDINHLIDHQEQCRWAAVGLLANIVGKLSVDLFPHASP